MNRLEQRQRRRRNSVLDDNMAGLPHDATACEERASEERDNKRAEKSCGSVLEGQAGIEGVPQTGGKKR